MFRYNGRSENGQPNPATASLDWRFQLPVEAARPGLELAFEYKGNGLPGQARGAFNIPMLVPVTNQPDPRPTTNTPEPAPTGFRTPVAVITNVPGRSVPIVPNAFLTYVNPNPVFTTDRMWALRLDSVTYGPSNSVRVNATVYSQADRRTIRASELRSSLFTAAPRGGFDHSNVYLSVNGRPIESEIDFLNKGYFNLDFEFNVGSEAALREISRLDVFLPDRNKVSVVVPPYAPPRPSTSTNQTPPSNTPAVRQPPADPVPLPGSEAALARYAGTYQTSMGSTLTLAMQGGLLTGQAQDGAKESVKLALTASGRVTGVLLTTSDVGVQTWYTLDMGFAADASSFDGQAAFFHMPSNSPIGYSGRRVGGATAGGSGAGSTPSSSGGAFTNAGYFALRADAVKRTGRSVEVNLTARNYQGGRQAVQQTDNRYFLATSRGEFRWDSNFYGATAGDHLDHTIWLEKDEQSQITYVFEGLPSDATPQRLIVRDYSGAEVGRLDLSGVGEKRAASSAPTDGSGGTPAVGSVIKLDNYEVTVERVARAPDRDWESVLTIRNASETPQRLTVTEIGMVLYGADDRAWHASGSFFGPDGADRSSRVGAPMLQPGEQVRLRLWHPQSAGATPVRFRVQEAGGKSAGGRL